MNPTGACDFRRQECTNDGEMVGDQWTCRNHLPSRKTPRDQAMDKARDIVWTLAPRFNLTSKCRAAFIDAIAEALQEEKR